MTTEIRVPITITGWIVLRDLKVSAIEVDPGWEYGPLPFVSDYGEDPDVIVFRDIGEPDRYEGDVNITQPIHDIIEAAGDSLTAEGFVVLPTIPPTIR